MLDKSPFRKYVLGTETMIPLNPYRLARYINFDNAATTPPLKAVLKAINGFSPWYSSIHRGKGYKSLLSSRLYEESRSIIADFLKIDLAHYTIIFVKNTTEAINKISNRFCQLEDKGECIILSTEMEHHSNDLPWRNKYKLDYIEVTGEGLLSLEDLEAKLIEHRGKVRLVTVTGASNVTGYINPIRKIAGLCRQYNARILVDAAQLIPHRPFNMSDHELDFLVFSGHKIYAPFGTGVLIGPTDFFRQGEPETKGGGTVQLVTTEEVLWNEPPWKDEAGTPNIMGVIALAESLKKIKEIGMEKIAEYEESLTHYTLKEMEKIPGVKLYNNKDSEIISIIPFNIEGLSHEEAADILAGEYGIGVRNGCFCAQPYIRKLLGISENEIKKHLNRPHSLHPGLVRISFGMYNEKEEVDYLLQAIREILKK